MNTIRPEKNFTADTGYGPSPAIWEGVRINDTLENFGVGVLFEDTFQRIPLPPTLTTQIAFGGYKAFATSGDTITRVGSVNSAKVLGGALQFSHNTDNNSCSLAQYGPGFSMSGDPTVDGPLYFEVCYAQNSIVTNLASTIIGLAETNLWTLATGVPLNAGDSPTNAAAFIGFQVKEDSLGAGDTVYSDRATSFTAVGTGEYQLAANTFTKLGFIYDPTKTTECVTFFKDNQKLTTKVARSTITGTTNLKANDLGFIFASVADSAGTSFSAWLKWIRIFQYFPGER